MSVTSVAITFDSVQPIDEYLSLRNHLVQEPSLRGQVGVKEIPQNNSLGAIADALIVGLGASGAGTVLASALVAWVKSRNSEISIRVKAKNQKEVLLEAKGVRKATSSELQKLISQAVRDLEI